MKKIILPLLLMMVISSVAGQNKNEATDKKDKTEKIKPENQGQQISDVNAWYKTERKAIKKDASLSKEARKAKLSFLKEEKNNQIHAINNGGQNKDIKHEKGEKEMKDKADHDSEMHDKKEKEMKDKKEHNEDMVDKKEKELKKEKGNTEKVEKEKKGKSKDKKKSKN